jgi:hypothetical protein
MSSGCAGRLSDEKALLSLFPSVRRLVNCVLRVFVPIMWGIQTAKANLTNRRSHPGGLVRGMSAYADLLWVPHSKVYEGRSLAATQNGDASGERLRASNPYGPRPFGAEGFGAWPPRCLSTHCPNSGWSLPASVDESRPPSAFGLCAG